MGYLLYYLANIKWALLFWNNKNSMLKCKYLSWCVNPLFNENTFSRAINTATFDRQVNLLMLLHRSGLHSQKTIEANFYPHQWAQRKKAAVVENSSNMCRKSFRPWPMIHIKADLSTIKHSDKIHVERLRRTKCIFSSLMDWIKQILLKDTWAVMYLTDIWEMLKTFSCAVLINSNMMRNKLNRIWAYQ